MGLEIERKQVVVDTERFQTSMPGTFAVGDIDTHPGKGKLILSGFHEATLAAFAATEYASRQDNIYALHDHVVATAQGARRRMTVAPKLRSLR
jgi:pyruvate/2-oxoglutarate dehydrogenase complex dihydrolipoamide dehydrogenase (E3) component